MLDYTDATFAELFRSVVGINIDHDRYMYNGTSKAKRMRAFWERESDAIVGKVLKEMLDVWKYQQDDSDEKIDKKYNGGLKIISRLLGKKITNEDFLHKDFEYSISNLDLPSGVYEQKGY